MVSEERRVFLKEGAICSGCEGTCNVQIIKRNRKAGGHRTEGRIGSAQGVGDQVRRLLFLL